MRAILNYKTIIFLFMLTFVSCGEPEFTIFTKVSMDGSCTRVLQVKNLERKDIDFKKFPISVDTTWQLTFHVDSVIDVKEDTEDVYYDTIFLYSKNFASVEEMNKCSYDTGNAYSTLERSVKLKKKFRWFYTFYNYSETYKALFPGENRNKYISDEEYIAMKDEKNDSLPIFAGLDTSGIKILRDSIEEKYWDWILRSVFYTYFEAFIETLNNNEGLAIYSDLLINEKENIYKGKDIMEHGFDTLYYFMDSIANADGKIILMKENKDSAIKEIDKKAEFWGDVFLDNSINYELLLPGLLSSTNADSIKSDTLEFNVNWDRYFAEDYIMQAETRILNKWTFYVSGIIVLLAILAFILGKRRNRN